MTTDAFADGMQARKLRRSINEVPYARDTAEYGEWRRGWEAMDRERTPNTYSVGDASEQSQLMDGNYRAMPTNKE